MWAAARPSSGACGADRGRSGRVGRPDGTPNRAATGLNGADPGVEAVLEAAAGVANTAGGLLAGIADHLTGVGARPRAPQGIEADRGGRRRPTSEGTLRRAGRHHRRRPGASGSRKRSGADHGGMDAHPSTGRRRAADTTVPER